MVTLDPNALATLEDVRLYLDFDQDETDEDEFLKTLINKASAQIEKRVGTFFKARDIVEDRDGNGGHRMILINRPINSLTEVNIDVQRNFTPSTAITLSAIVVSKEEGIISFEGVISVAASGFFPIGEKNIRIKYNGASILIPADIELGAIKLVAAHFAKAREGGDGIASESVGGRSVSWIEGFPPDVLDIIRQHETVGGI